MVMIYFIIKKNKNRNSRGHLIEEINSFKQGLMSDRIKYIIKEGQ